MVTASVWADLDGDGQDELIIAGDWMPIRIFKSDHGQLKELTGFSRIEQQLWHVEKPRRS